MKLNFGWPIIGLLIKWKNLFQNAPILALATAQGLRLAGPAQGIGAQAAPGETSLVAPAVAL
jgi:hypothetical protein